MKRRIRAQEFRNYSHALWHVADHHSDDDRLVIAYVLVNSWLVLHPSSWVEADDVLDELAEITGIEFGPGSRAEFLHIYIGKGAYDEFVERAKETFPSAFHEMFEHIANIKGDTLANEFLETNVRQTVLTESQKSAIDPALNIITNKYSRLEGENVRALSSDGRGGLTFSEKMGVDAIEHLIDSATGELGNIESIVGKWAEGLG